MTDPRTNDALSVLTLDESALIAASQAIEASAGLLLFAREGPPSDTVAFNDDVVCKLAEALKLAIDIENPAECDYLDEDEKAVAATLHASLVAFIKGWVG